MKNFIILLIVLFSVKVSSQQTFKSKSFSYSITAPRFFSISQNPKFDFFSSFMDYSIGVVVTKINSNPTAREFHEECTNETIISRLAVEAPKLPNPKISSRGLGNVRGMDYAYYAIKTGNSYKDEITLTSYLFFKDNYMYTVITSYKGELNLEMRNTFKTALQTFTLY